MQQKKQLLRRQQLRKRSLRTGMSNAKKQRNNVKPITGKKIHALKMLLIKHQIAQKNVVLLPIEMTLKLILLQMWNLYQTQLQLQSHQKRLHLGRNQLNQKRVIVQLSNWLIFLMHLAMLRRMMLMILINFLIRIDLLVMIMYMFQMRIIHIHLTKAILMSLKQQDILRGKNLDFPIKIQRLAHWKLIMGLLRLPCQVRVLLLVL